MEECAAPGALYSCRRGFQEEAVSVLWLHTQAAWVIQSETCCVKEGGSQETPCQAAGELVLQSPSSPLSASQAARPPQALPATEPVLGTNPSSSILNNQWHPVQTTSDHVGPALTCQWLPSQSQILQYRICHCDSLHSPRSSLRAPWILHGHSRPAPASGSNCCSLCFQCSSQRWAWLSPSPLPGLYPGVTS